MRILALDLATTTGWAVLGGGVVTSGSQNFTRHTGNKSRAPDHDGASYAMFHRWLVNKLHEDKPDVVAYEESAGHFKSVHASRICFGFRGVMLSVLAAHHIHPCGYAATSVKKHWTGNGRADKDQMIAELFKRMPGLDLSDANECDAIALLDLHTSKSKNPQQVIPAAGLRPHSWTSTLHDVSCVVA